MKILVDTNIIIDALTGREPFREEAEQIFLLAANHVGDMYITASSAADVYYLVRKYLHSTEQAKSIMEKLYELFQILDVTAGDCKDALLTDMIDYEISVISCSAAHNNIDYIVTRNIKDYEKSKVQAILPNQLIGMVSQDDI